jgi:hypothetical protein
MIGGLEAGRTYTVSVASRRYTFTPQVVSLTEDLVGMDLISQ